MAGQQHDEHGMHGMKVGDVIDGKYRVDGVLGTGGMAVVWSAHHLQLDERVALKVLRRDCAENPEALTRFRREARAAVKIKGEHVARVMDVGALGDGTPYMVMEHLDGSDLAEWLRTSGRLPLVQAVEFVLQAAEALAEAHALGIVHRDLKPANLFVTRRPDGSPSVKVLDFGISKLAPELGTASNITHRSALVGTPLYMSPEQLSVSKQVDARTDIWALGVILYELLSGEPPFTAETMPEVVHQIGSEAPVPLRLLRPEVPIALEIAIARCLEKDREARFSHVGSFARALAPFAGELGRASSDRVTHIIEGARRAGAGLATTPLPQAGVRPALRFWPHATTITGKRALRVGTAASAVLAVGALLWAQQHSAAPPPAAELQTELAPSGVLLAPASAPAPAAAPPAAEAKPVLTPVVPALPQGLEPPALPRSPTRPRGPAVPATSPRAPSAVPAAALEAAPAEPAQLQASPPIAEPREPAPARDRDRDASVKAMGDDLRPLLDAPRRPRTLEDPFR
jgi:eukaryotic-like serine/threonine-protein kinase